MTRREPSQLVALRDPEQTVIKKSLAQSIKQCTAHENQENIEAALYGIMGHSETLRFPEAKIAEYQKNFFKGWQFKTVPELDEAEASLGNIN